MPNTRAPAQGQKPLSGLRIVDLTSVIMGPYATQILADYGADVIKVEAPSGDTTRQIPPMRNPSMGSTFLHLNRNKRSLALDFKTPEGIDALRRLCLTADVLISNIRPQAMRRLGLDYEELAAEHPRLIWLSLVGFGSDGPYAGRPAYDDLIQGLTAVPSMLVQAGSEQPHYMPVSFNDRAVGLHAAIALLSAVHQRHATGLGQQIEVPMFETMVQFTLGDHMGGEMFEPALGPPGYPRTLTPHRRPFPTADGHICVTIYTDAHWRAFFRINGEPDRFDTDPRVQSLLTRTTYADELNKELRSLLATRSTAFWLAAFAEADIPAAPLHSLASVFEDEHLTATGFFHIESHPSEGEIRQMAIPTRWSSWQPGPNRPAPRLGEHGAEILAEAGLTAAEIQAALTARRGRAG